MQSHDGRISLKHLFERVAIEFAVLDDNQAGREQTKSVRELQVIGRLQRIGRSNWSEWNTHIQRGQHE